MIVSDASGLTASTSFRVEIRPVNDPPWLSSIPDQVALQGQGLFTVPFSAWDVESSSKINFQAWSSRQGIVSNSALRIVPGFGISNRVLQVTLGPQGGAGSSAITIQANDQQDTNRASFILNVQEPEFTLVNQGLPVAQDFQPVWGDFNGDGLLDLVVSPTQIRLNGSGGLARSIQLPGGVGITSAAPADFDGDGNLDVLLLGETRHLLRNNGGNPPAFSEVPLPIASPGGSRAFWADLDGDGDLDILTASVGAQSYWMRNDGPHGFVSASLGLPLNISGTVLAVGDFDSDGDPDLLVAATATVPALLQLYENDGTGHFQAAPISLPQARTLAAGWADVDGDGLPDLWLVQAASSQISSNSLVVLRQTPPDRFAEAFRLNLTTTFSSSGAITNLAWADFDNDGHVDFAGPFFKPGVPTTIPPTNYTVIYHNDGIGRFSTTGLPASLERGQLVASVGDFNDDGSTDLLYRSGNTLLSLRNQARALNSLPDAPSGLRAFAAGNLVTLFWNDAHDGNQTAALTYNVRIGTAPGRNDVVPSMSTTNGTRMISAPGNAGFNNWMVLELPFDQLNVETLYWSVQAVDASFQGGPFAAEQTFFINPPGNRAPTIVGIGDIAFAEDTTTNMTFYIRDDRTPPSGVRVQATSSNPSLISANGLHLSDFTATDQGLRVRLSVTPQTNQFGDATVTITATDRGGLSASRFFVATVTPVNDPPGITAAETFLALAGSPTPPLPIQVSDLESSADQLVVTARSLTPTIVPDSNLALTHGAGGNWTLVATPLNAELAQAQIELTATDPQDAQVRRTINVIFQEEVLTPYASMLATDPWPNQLIWADVNNDHKLELLVSNVGGFGVSVYTLDESGLHFVSKAIATDGEAYPLDVGDYDNDGRLDLLVDVRVGGPSPYSRQVLYRNQGNLNFKPLPGVSVVREHAQFADLNQDGRLDIVFGATWSLTVYWNTVEGFVEGPQLWSPRTGVSGWFKYNQVLNADFRGGSQSAFTIVTSSLGQGMYGFFPWSQRDIPGWTTGAAFELADFDQDGMPDLLSAPSSGMTKEIWRNEDDQSFASPLGAFSDTTASFALADFTGDGEMDVFAYGNGSNALHAGHRDFSFSSIQLPFAQANVAVAAPVDFDGDGVMDIALGMSLTNGPIIAVYRGLSQTTNHPPASPMNLRAQTVGTNSVILSWDRATDPEQSGGLTYNVRVGTAPGLADVISPMSLPDGFRMVVKHGNAGWSTNRLLTALQPGRTYYWSAQAVDNSFVGGRFAAEVSFTMPAAALTLNPLGADQLEIELRAAPNTAWRLEMSNDLKNWGPYMLPDLARTGTNGVCRIHVAPAGARLFYRARQMP